MKATKQYLRPGVRQETRKPIDVDGSVGTSFPGSIRLTLTPLDGDGERVHGQHFDVFLEREEAARFGFELTTAARTHAAMEACHGKVKVADSVAWARKTLLYRERRAPSSMPGLGASLGDFAVLRRDYCAEECVAIAMTEEAARRLVDPVVLAAYRALVDVVEGKVSLDKAVDAARAAAKLLEGRT